MESKQNIDLIIYAMKQKSHIETSKLNTENELRIHGVEILKFKNIYKISGDGDFYYLDKDNLMKIIDMLSQNKNPYNNEVFKKGTSIEIPFKEHSLTIESDNEKVSIYTTGPIEIDYLSDHLNLIINFLNDSIKSLKNSPKDIPQQKMVKNPFLK